MSSQVTCSSQRVREEIAITYLGSCTPPCRAAELAFSLADRRGAAKADKSAVALHLFSLSVQR